MSKVKFTFDNFLQDVPMEHVSFVQEIHDSLMGSEFKVQIKMTKTINKDQALIS